MKRAPYETFDAYEVAVKMEGSLEDYALNFLKIFNTVKSNSSDLIRITNGYQDQVYVVCMPEVLEETKDYLSNFGEVYMTNLVQCIQITDDLNYDMDKYYDLVVVPDIQ